VTIRRVVPDVETTDLEASRSDEPWDVRRFFVRDPNGVVVNVLQHR
jgi:hypothetical protein